MATAAASSVSTEPSDLECSVCHENFTDPKLLPCAHLVCRECLVTFCRSNPDSPCPLCRCSILTTRERPGQNAAKSLEDLAEELPTDVAMEALVEATSLLAGHHACCVCVQVAAVSMCLQCGDMFCQACTSLHQKQSLSKHHDVENLTSLTAQKLASTRRKTCATHADKKCELFCSSHGESICHICAASKHRGCQDVKDLEDKVKEARVELAQMVDTLSMGESELNRAIGELDQQLQKAEERAQDDIAKIEAACDRVENSTKACRQRLKSLVLDATSEVKESVNEKRRPLEIQRVRMMSHKRLAERVQDMSIREADMTTVLKHCVKDLDCSATLPAQLVSQVTFTMESAALSRVEKELENLGRIEADEAVAVEEVAYSSSTRKDKVRILTSA